MKESGSRPCVTPRHGMRRILLSDCCLQPIKILVSLQLYICNNVFTGCVTAIATSQCVLFLVENHYSSRRGAPPSGSFSLLQEAIEEARQLYCERKRLTSESLDAAEAITNSCLETLRVTAHSIGAVRKVVSPVGWKVRADTPSMELNVEGEGEGEGSASTLVQREYVIPYGAYVGASHIVPHRDPEV